MKSGELVNEPAAKANLEYQTRMYRRAPKESDKVILDLLAKLPGGELLDIGCSNGNLLKHIKSQGLPFTLNGGDVSELRVQACRDDPELFGINFAVMNALDLPRSSYDVIVANAVLYAIENIAAAMHSVSRALRPSGRFIAFDFFLPYRQNLTITERSDELPEGHTIHMRAQQSVRDLLGTLEMSVEFYPFKLPIELSIDHSQTLRTHTVRSGNDNLQFRGAIFQPWCHLIATRK